MSSKVWYIATSHIHITGNWTLKPTESRKEHNLGILRSEQIEGHRGITVAPHSFRQRLFYPEGFVVWNQSNSCINALSSPPLSLSSWAGVDHNAMLTYCFILQACFLSECHSTSGIKVFGLATHLASAVFICCHVRVLELLQEALDLDSCVNSCFVWTTNSLTSVPTKSNDTGTLEVWHKNVKLAGKHKTISRKNAATKNKT